jgi:excisionase family DNA binding protein
MATANQTDRLLTREQAAEVLSVKPQTLAVWACTGRYGLPHIKMGSSVRYRLSDLEKFIADRTVEFTMPE